MTYLLVLTMAVLQAAPSPATAPADTLSLAWAYEAAASNFPRSMESGAQDEMLALRLKNLDTAYLPALALNGQAVYQSEVASIPFGMPGTSPPAVPHDQYKVGLGIQQLVYDGGMVKGRKSAATAAADVARQEVQVATYGLRERVEAAFFGVLLADAQAESLRAIHEDLSARAEQAAARVRGGVGTQVNGDALRAEVIRIEQQQAVAASRRRAGLDALELLTGERLPDDAMLALPNERPAARGRRPEAALFAFSRTQLAQQGILAERRNRPKVQTFGEAAFGQPPGLNLFENSFKPFFSVGLRVSWPVWDWQDAQRDRQEITIRQEIVTAQERAFEQSVRLAAAQARREIEQYQAMLARDAEIIALREGIAVDAASRMDRGVATATDYLIERNAAFQAQLAEKQHGIQLMQARARYNTIVGAQ